MKFTSYLSGTAIMLAAMAFALPLAHEDNTVEKRQGIQTYHNYVTLKGTADAADASEGDADAIVKKRQGIQTYHNYVTLKGTADAADETEG
jgi:hypothetical protein